MLAGNLCTTGLQRSAHRQRHLYRTTVIILNVLVADMGSESFDNLPCPGQRTSQQRLFTSERNRLGTYLSHKRNHHTGQQAGLSDVQYRIAVLIHRRLTILATQTHKAFRLSSNTPDSQHVSILLHFRTEISRHLQGCLIVATGCISLQMRYPVRKSRSNDGTLGETLGHRHCTPRAVFTINCTWSPGIQGYRGRFRIIFAPGPDKPEIPIDSLTHFCCRPLSRSRRFLGIERCVCIWSTIFQTIQTGLLSGFTHTERDETSISQCAYPFIAVLRLRAAPLI